jgi:hypothetical protein
MEMSQSNQQARNAGRFGRQTFGAPSGLRAAYDVNVPIARTATVQRFDRPRLSMSVGVRRLRTRAFRLGLPLVVLAVGLAPRFAAAADDAFSAGARDAPVAVDVLYHADLDGRFVTPRCAGTEAPAPPSYAQVVGALNAARAAAQAAGGRAQPIVLLGGNELAPGSNQMTAAGSRCWKPAPP